MSNISYDPRSPNFFILGAAKAGTTTLYEYLVCHTDIFMSRVKEPQFFSHDELYRQGMPFYLERFFQGSVDSKLRGEATPHYLYYEKVAARLAENLEKDALRFIVMLRDPIARSYSLYWNMVAEGIENLSFEEALAAEAMRRQDPALAHSGEVSLQYVDSSRYARQIRDYLNYFQRKQFMFVLFEEFKENPHAVLNAICDFLGLSRFEELPQIGNTNSAGMPRSPFVQRFLRGSSGVKKIVGRCVPQQIKYTLVTRLLDINKKEVRYPSICPDTQQQLLRLFAEDIHELESITGLSLARWKVTHG